MLAKIYGVVHRQFINGKGRHDSSAVAQGLFPTNVR